jgi:hypothetical protein
MEMKNIVIEKFRGLGVKRLDGSENWMKDRG